MLRKSDRVQLAPRYDGDGYKGHGLEGKVTGRTRTPEFDYANVRWSDGSQSSHPDHELLFADHPDFTRTEEVLAWLEN